MIGGILMGLVTNLDSTQGADEMSRQSVLRSLAVGIVVAGGALLSGGTAKAADVRTSLSGGAFMMPAMASSAFFHSRYARYGYRGYRG